MIEPTLDALHPAELALRDWVRDRLDASIVCEMAALDYGVRVEEYRQGIEELLLVRRLPAELPWTPREVLQLSSYARPEDARGHVARLFACLVLVRADDLLEPAGTLATLVESAVELGPDATQAAVRYLAWCRRHAPGAWHDDAEVRPFLTLGLLLAYLLAPRPEPAIVAALNRAFADEVEAAPPAALKKTAGGPGWRAWQRLAARARAEGHDLTLPEWSGPVG
ncbi:hypothetical protein [Phytohabitans houttuyneae]|uniref:Uncharacterized protein n=1 Tax=Phytohabitans houttuyneae TaxID=1076126 RepID=A0A6V8KEQ1_9ACTN|nr:hypothetical protein [Phytohabitans houttuyneae]GFJ82284.1 hypothetical protein Phou_064640 [Phytohabitans houttuyneae]